MAASMLSTAELLNPTTGARVAAADLMVKPVVFLVLRRPGCVLCRAEAQKLWTRRSDIELAGATMVCVVHEWRDAEIEAFRDFWGGPVYLDTSKAFYKAVNNGEVLRGSLTSLLKPATWSRIMEARKQVANHNVIGDGLTMGGMLIFGAGGTGPFLTHLETDLGVHAPYEDVLQAVREAAGSQQQSQPLPDAIQVVSSQNTATVH